MWGSDTGVSTDTSLLGRKFVRHVDSNATNFFYHNKYLLACLDKLCKSLVSNFGEYTIILSLPAFPRPFQEVSRYYITTASFHSLSSSLPTIQYRIV